MTVTFRSLIGNRPNIRITTGELGALLADKERPSDVTIESLRERWKEDEETGYEASRRFIEFWTRDPLRSEQKRIAEPGALGHGAAAVGYELATVAIRGLVTSLVGGNTFTVDDGSGPVDVEVPDVDERTKMVALRGSSTPVVVIADMGTREHSVVARRVYDRGLFEIPAALVERFATGDVDLVWAGLPHEPLEVGELVSGSYAALGGWGGRSAPRDANSEETGMLVVVQGRVRDPYTSPLIIEDVNQPELAIAVLGPRTVKYERGQIACVTGHVVLLGSDLMSRSIPHFVAVRGIRVGRPPAPAEPREQRIYETIDREDTSDEPEGIQALVVHAWHDFHLMRRVRVVAAQSGDFPDEDRLVVEVCMRRDAMGGECWMPPSDTATEARILAEAALRLQLKPKE